MDNRISYKQNKLTQKRERGGKLPLAWAALLIFAATSLAGQEGPNTPTSQKGQKGAVKIQAVGDMVPGTNFPDASRLPQGGADSLFQQVKGLFTADLVIGNYESTFTDYPKTRKDTSRKLVFAFRSPPSYAPSFQKAGFDVLNIANNHSYDFFSTGFEDTAKAIEGAGMTVTGKKGQISIVEKNGLKIAIIGYSYLSYHNSVHRLEESGNLVAQASKSADMVIVTVHMGAEGNSALHTKNKDEMFYSENRGNPVRFAHAMIDKGADLVLGHGPHVPRALELYKGRLIAYSLGNFMGYKVFSIRENTGVSLILEAELAADGTFVGGKIIPVALSSTGVPMPDPQNKSISLLQTLSRDDFPGDELIIQNDGTIGVKAD